KAELRGRLWAYKIAANPEKRGRFPTDSDNSDIYELHRIMFEPIYDWAGNTRMDARGPGAKEFVPFHQVRMELRMRFENLRYQLEQYTIDGDVDIPIEQIAEWMARAHHDFQYVHPFTDTNGRTGRVLDHYHLWTTFEL